MKIGCRQLLPLSDRPGADKLLRSREISRDAKAGTGTAGLEDRIYQLLIPIGRLDKDLGAMQTL